MSKTKIIALVVVGIILLVIIFFIAKNLTTTTTSTSGGGTNVQQAGIGDFLGNIFSSIFKPKTKEDPCAGVVCDPNRPGWNMDGLYDNCCQ